MSFPTELFTAIDYHVHINSNNDDTQCNLAPSYRYYVLHVPHKIKFDFYINESKRQPIYKAGVF
jgi:hypothetical protein